MTIISQLNQVTFPPVDVFWPQIAAWLADANKIDLDQVNLTTGTISAWSATGQGSGM